MASRETGPPVVVGYDGSKHAERALRWAVAEARHRWSGLVICHAWQWAYPMPPSADMLETIRQHGRHVIDQGVYIATGLAPDLPVRTRLLSGPASSALVSESQQARMVVLGTRGLGGFTDLRLGATAVQVPTHAACPVVVVGGTAPEWRSPGPVVVGVEGSPASAAAVGFAAEEAALRETTLRAVCVLGDEVRPPDAPPAPYPDRGGARAGLEASVRSILSLWRERYPRVRMDASFVAGPPRRTLREAAADAVLLVVGDHGVACDLPGLGPVTQAMLHYAPCAVAVVPDPTRIVT
jgi:nucleotide-binding universal stress UspA family protein